MNDRPRWICSLGKCAMIAAGKARQRELYAAENQGQERLSEKRQLKYQMIFNPCENSEQTAQIVSQSIQNSVTPMSEPDTPPNLHFHRST